MNQSSQPEHAIESSSKTDSSSEKKKLTIVGIGASAGGLAALKTFFAQIPQDSGLAFVVVVHLSPDHESHLANLLQPHVAMPVQQVTTTLPLEPNNVYVIPPGCNLSSIDSHLRLSDLEERRRERAPIDHFFRTLAATHDGHSVGIILTGTGSDGTLGLREIKMKGGLTLVQDPSEAEFDGMPQSAIATGLVDLILPLAEIPPAIVRYHRTHPRVQIPQDEDELQEQEQQLLSKVFAQIRARTGRDFSRYKRTTILRRITRRMQIRHLEELPAYLKLLREQPEEVQTLANDLLITVTSFFRDPDVFEQLEQKVIPQLFEEKQAADSIRVWSVGCATGEEAYSLAILLLEEAARREAAVTLQVFASDLQEHSLQKAREGIYPGDIATDVSEERLSRFFEKQEGAYRIRQEVRELVVFAPHNLLGDPPFSKLDLVSCRNVLIYLQRPVQREVMELFHYALKPEGYLVLGNAETIESAELFRLQDKKHCLYRKRNVPAPEPRLPVFPLTLARLPHNPEGLQPTGEPMAYGMLHQKMVEQYAPPSLLVSPDDKVVHLSEHVGRYLVHPGGEPTMNIFKLVREELHIELRSALHAARQQGESTTTKPIPVHFPGEPTAVVLHVRSSPESQQQGFVLVIFEEYRKDKVPVKESLPAATKETSDDDRVPEVEAELALTKKRLQDIIEEYETSQEEMKASNEEMQSANEELRSTLEELETGKEELQSMNEELSTVNQENRHKVEELAQLSGDLQNLLSATDIATLFLDRQLRILRFTPQVGELFNIRMTDRGRPLFDITHRLGYDDLQRVSQQVLAKLIPIEREVQDEQGRWYLTRILPYRSTEDRIEGVVITFVDISSRKAAELTLRQSEEHLRLILESATDYAIFTLDRDRKITDWNAGAELMFGYTKEEIVGQSGDVVYIQEDRDTEPEQETQKAKETGRAINERWHVGKDGRRFWGSGAMMPLKDAALRGYLKIMTDNTERRQMEEALRAAKEEAERAAQAKEDFLAHMSHEIRTPLNAISGLSSLLLKHNQQAKLTENLETLKFSAENLRLLINDILDFSKIQAGKVLLEEAPVPLSFLLHSLQKVHEPAAKSQKTQLSIQLDERIPAVVCTDQVKLSQILNNLISNALKFTQAGSVKVEVFLEKRKNKRLWVAFSVQDTGVGIPSDKLESIFEAFTQADISTGRKFGGTGLGLSITRLLLDLMGSQIEVESEEGKGSRFFFTLPMREGLPEETTEILSSAPESEQEEQTMELLRVLIVEDAAVNRMVLLQFLQDWWNLIPDEAENGAKAIEMARRQRYDLILMDVRMPEVDGYQAAKAIRQLPGYDEVPILALTADTVQEVEKHSEATLFNDVITKPFDIPELQQKMIQHTSAKRAPTEHFGTSASDGLNLQQVKEIFGSDTEKIREFLELVQHNLTEFQAGFATLMQSGDATRLDDQTHKMRMQLELLELNALADLLDQCQRLLEKPSPNASQFQEEEVQQKVEAMLRRVTISVGQSLRQL